VTADPFGGRLHHEYRPLFDRATEIAAATEGIIDDEGNAVLVGDMVRAAKSGILNRGLPIVSTYKALVRSSIAARKASASSPSTNLTFIPKRGRETLN
jgi:hypothetical protein